jgi:hypothetical protein
MIIQHLMTIHNGHGQFLGSAFYHEGDIEGNLRETSRPRDFVAIHDGLE